jgi:hypothetical protein
MTRTSRILYDGMVLLCLKSEKTASLQLFYIGRRYYQWRKTEGDLASIFFVGLNYAKMGELWNENRKIRGSKMTFDDTKKKRGVLHTITGINIDYQ